MSAKWLWWPVSFPVSLQDLQFINASITRPEVLGRLLKITSSWRLRWVLYYCCQVFLNIYNAHLIIKSRDMQLWVAVQCSLIHETFFLTILSNAGNCTVCTHIHSSFTLSRLLFSHSRTDRKFWRSDLEREERAHESCCSFSPFKFLPALNYQKLYIFWFLFCVWSLNDNTCISIALYFLYELKVPSYITNALC